MRRLPPSQALVLGVAVTVLALSSGCTSFSRRHTVAPCGVPSMRDGGYRSTKEPINYIRLRQDPPAVYMLGPRDTLGIYIESVVPKSEEPPPVHFPEEGSNLPPAIGYPFPVREDGTISLPYVPPINVTGCTLAQAERKIRTAYTVTQKILAPGRDRIIVTLMKPRTYQVMVIREDTRPTVAAADQGKGNLTIGSERRGATNLVELRAYENDVLHALVESGGLPGLEAKNEVTILRGAFNDAVGANSIISEFMSGNPPLAPGESPNILRIPLRVTPGDPMPIVAEQDIILNDGDIVFIQSRDAEVFYTGGLLIGGQHPIPRDYDLDVLGAIAMAGGSIAAAAGGSGTVGNMGRGGVGSIFPPTRIIVLRQVNGRQCAYEIDVREAMFDPSQRILIQPNDMILLEYTMSQVVMNVILNNFDVRFSLDSLWN